MTWVSSFSTHVAIVAEAHPERVGDMLAYMRLIIREASKFGGSGWLMYNSVFRRNQEGLPSPWNHIDHQVYIANQQDKVAVPCKHCHEIDHPASDCAVASVLPKTISSLSEPSLRSPSPEWPGLEGKCPAPYSRQRPICTLWNGGNCKFPGKCANAHVCANCYGSHPASSCRERPYISSTIPRKLPLGPAKLD